PPEPYGSPCSRQSLGGSTYPIVAPPGGVLEDAVLTAAVVELPRPAGEGVDLLDPPAAPGPRDLAVPGLVEAVPAAVLVVLEPDPALLAAALVHPVPLREDLAVLLPRLAEGVGLVVAREDLAPLAVRRGGGGLGRRRADRQAGDGHRAGQGRDREGLAHWSSSPFFGAAGSVRHHGHYGEARPSSVDESTHRT